MWRVKRIGWRCYVRKMRKVYREGLADLDKRAAGDFAALCPSRVVTTGGRAGHSNDDARRWTDHGGHAARRGAG